MSLIFNQHQQRALDWGDFMMTKMAPIREEEIVFASSSAEDMMELTSTSGPPSGGSFVVSNTNNDCYPEGDDMASGAFPVASPPTPPPCFGASPITTRRYFLFDDDDDDDDDDHVAPFMKSQLAGGAGVLTCNTSTDSKTSATSEDVSWEKMEERQDEEIERRQIQLQQLKQELQHHLGGTKKKTKKRNSKPDHNIPLFVVASRSDEEDYEGDSSVEVSTDLVAALRALSKQSKPQIPEMILLEGMGEGGMGDNTEEELETLVSKLTMPEELQNHLKTKRKGWLEDDAMILPTSSDLSSVISQEEDLYSYHSAKGEGEEKDRVRGMELFFKMGQRRTIKGCYSGRVNAKQQAHGNGIVKFDDDNDDDDDNKSQENIDKEDAFIMYMGEFQNGQMHGDGTLVLGGDTLRGEFYHNLFVV